MSLQRFRDSLRKERPGGSESTWFLRWLQQYVEYCCIPNSSTIPVDAERVIEFLKGLKAQGAPA